MAFRKPSQSLSVLPDFEAMRTNLCPQIPGGRSTDWKCDFPYLPTAGVIGQAGLQAQAHGE
jgi:hypothetical protein